MSVRSEPQSILLVEDDPALALGLGDALEFEGFRVLNASTGSEALQLARENRPDCIVLDLMLPDMNGYQVCEQLREDAITTPIMMLTARSQESDKIRGLDAGADDYVTKPFSVGEVLARVRALLRRADPRRGEAGLKRIEVGRAVVDPIAQTLTTADGEEHQLSYYEVELLRYLYDRRGEPVSRDEILDRIWGIEANPTNRTVDNFIVKLRKKIEPDPSQPRHILTVYGIGYKLVL
ncbi:MAG: response regulator transcription factor [Myxococcales bacterium]|nr:response regulator transcription factor [Myxococcales bacterium]